MESNWFERVYSKRMGYFNSRNKIVLKRYDTIRWQCDVNWLRHRGRRYCDGIIKTKGRT